MTRYLVWRLFRAAILLLGVSIVSFCLFELAPSDYFDDLRLHPSISPATLEALRQHYGIEDPVVVRYRRWIGSVVRGEWGYSVAYNTPAGALLFTRAHNTLLLTCSAMTCAWIIAIPFALWTASGSRWRQLFGSSTVAVLLSLPDVLTVLVLMSLAAHWSVLPTGGITSLNFDSLSGWRKAWDVVSHLALPLIALVLAALPTLILHARVALIEALDAPFVKFARANGISGMPLLLRHVLPAASNPLITLFGLSVGTLLSSSLLVEVVAGWPGLGDLLFQSLLQRDLLVVAGAVLLSSVFLVTGNLLTDLLLYASDARVGEVR